MRNPLSVPIIKPVNGACNLYCSYCYMHSLLEPQKSKHAVMSLDTLSATIDFFCSHQDEIEFIWHGGEPLLAGKQFYCEVARKQDKWKARSKKIANFVQTNGVLVDNEWARLFAELDFYVGVSLDAPSMVHDKLRVLPDESGSIEKVLKGIDYLKANGVFNGVSCCVGRWNCHQPEEIIDFFLQHGIYSIKFLRIKAPRKEAVSANQYADFLIRVFRYWIEIDNPALEIRDVKSVVDLLLGGEFRECTFMGRCDQFATVYSDGSLFVCDSFLNEPQWHFGSVYEAYSEVLGRDTFQSLLASMEQVRKKCYLCRWMPLCNGGCLKDRLSGDGSEVCKANQRIFEEIESSLKQYELLAR